MADIIRPIEPFQLTQGFGSNSTTYAKFGLKGHNGWDFKTKFDDTPKGQRDILASWLMEFYRQGIDPPGYGNFFETVCKLKSIWKLTYAHCLSIKSFPRATEGESMAISDNTGFSTGSHLHLTAKRIKIVDGVHVVQNHSNGYFGAVNPQEFFDEVRAYKLSGKKPVIEGGLVMQVDQDVYGMLVNKSTERDEIRAYLGVPTDPLDDKASKVKGVIDGLRNVATGLQRQLSEAQTREQNKIDELARYKQTAEASAKTEAARISALEKAQKAWETERGVLQGQITEHATAEGNAKIEATQWKTKYEQAIAGTTSSLSLGDVLVLLFKKTFGIKLK